MSQSRITRRQVGKLGLSAAAAGLLAGRGAAQAQGLTKASMRLKWVAQAQFAGFYVAKEKKFYEAEGIDMTINPGGPNISGEALVASGADTFGVGGGVESHLSSREKKLPIVAIGMMHQRTPFVFVTHDDSGITKVEDFKGKKVSVWFTGSQFTLYAVMAKRGVSQSDVTIVPQSVSMTPFINKEVDVATVTLYNEYNVLKARGVTKIRIFAPDDYGIKTQRDTVITSEKLIQENPKLVQGFLNASARGWKYAFQNKKEAIDILLKAAPSLERPHQEAMLDEIEKLMVAGEGTKQGLMAVDRDGITTAHAFLHEAKAISGPVDLNAAFDPRFHAAVPDAYKKM